MKARKVSRYSNINSSKLIIVKSFFYKAKEINENFSRLDVRKINKAIRGNEFKKGIIKNNNQHHILVHFPKKRCARRLSYLLLSDTQTGETLKFD